MFKNLKISTKIYAIVISLLLLLGLIGYAGHSALDNVAIRVSRSDEMQSIVKNLLEARRHEKNLIIRADPLYRDNTLKAIDDVKRQAKESKDYFKDPNNKRLMDEVISSVTDYETAFRKLSEVVLAGNAQKSTLEEIDKIMVAAARKTQESCELVIKDVKQKMADTVVSADRLIIILSGLALLLGAAVSFLIARSLTTSIQEIIGSARSIAKGDFSGEGLDAGTSELGQLRQAFNEMTANVSLTLKETMGTAATVSVSAQKVHSAAEEISVTIGEAAIQVSAVASAGSQLAAASEEIAKNCELAAASASNAMKSAQDGSTIIDNTIQLMRQIAVTVDESSRTVTSLGERSSQIGSIIGTIREIADQTNLLALNAAIEAARAGEQGRGFAVVADEVRKLAERTTKETHEIGQMIKAIQDETKSAVSAMGIGMRQVDAGTAEAAHSEAALREIMAQVDAVSAQVSHIAAATEEQTVATEEISSNMESIAASIEKTAEESQEATNVANSMNGIAEKLMAGIGKFTLNEDVALAINKAKSAHMIFVGKIKAHLGEALNVDPEGLPTHLTCAFGKWYQGKGHEACGHNDLFKEIDAPHSKVHELGKQAIRAYNAGDKLKARALCSEMTADSMKLVGILDKLLETTVQVNKMPNH
ncbi:MAG: methyl-accepting chemotaxis protein [Betaproteobacteria bacterium]